MSDSARAASVVVVGAGGHARVVADILRLTGHAISGFLDEVNTDRWATDFEGARVLGGLDQLAVLFGSGVRHAFIAVGECHARLRLAQAAKEAGFALPALQHPKSVVASGVNLGSGSLIVAGAIVNPGARLGDQVIVNTAASVDHDCQLEDGVHVCPGARLAGGVVVGRGAWVGVGAIVKEGLRIGAGATIGAGSVVLEDVPPGVVAFGSPARVVRSVEGGKRAHR
jgi:sugar O-acyltransferase (sialic acid O-acetyltransferase NeuD family)